jgi:hypothetical protein
MPIMSINGVEQTITDEELAAMQYVSPEAEAHDVRFIRENLMAETDVWALSDRTMTAEQTAYRQALRDITDQAGFPTNITWPQEPSA